MKSDLYLFVDVTRCQRENHKLRPIWSDKNPLRVHLSCATCSASTKKQAFCAYGDETKSFGAWRSKRRTEPEAVEEMEA